MNCSSELGITNAANSTGETTAAALLASITLQEKKHGIRDLMAF
jgi:hypothetical protein